MTGTYLYLCGDLVTSSVRMSLARCSGSTLPTCVGLAAPPSASYVTVIIPPSTRYFPAYVLPSLSISTLFHGFIRHPPFLMHHTRGFDTRHPQPFTRLALSVARADMLIQGR